ncbi:hypothetical protein HL666_33490 [Bradyrhizobium sp. 83002]|uniref:hypothetical protein n=1 Tax=Bradyrhizobium aeschynomenes TaxID=2734909 RepID=UPI00155542A4|nr:hypothetical protein [Bradyrhizobium aeschynomenes]NPU15678.1 hypothetical protein [Bradyrhizobium aeschynomenes]
MDHVTGQVGARGRRTIHTFLTRVPVSWDLRSDRDFHTNVGVSVMVRLRRILLFNLVPLLAACPALAQPTPTGALEIDASVVTQWAITLLGLATAARLAWSAFGRDVAVDEFPTIPRYMTNRSQYLLGSIAYTLFACGVFLVLVREHQPILAMIPPGIIPEPILKAIDENSAPYLAVVAAMGAVYLYLLTKEADWNLLLGMRDVIHLWISVPQLAKEIIAQIRYALRVSEKVIPLVVANSRALTERDFQKDRQTPDRLWAEICYMNWWLQKGHEAGNDATFFTEASFGYDKLIAEFEQTSWTMKQRKSGSVATFAIVDFDQGIKRLHSRFARLIACYLIYRNGSRRALCAEAREFGVDVDAPVIQNPLQYWIIYAVVLIAAAHLGVYLSAVAFDALQGQGLVMGQDSGRMLAWVLYSMSNFGFAIGLVLVLRLAAHSLGSAFDQSPMVTYCWTFLVAFAAGPFGLALAVHVFGEDASRALPFSDLYFRMLRWGLGPALVSVYISYYLDRQSCSALPDIDMSPSRIFWRNLNCLAFSLGVVFLLLPSLFTLLAPEGAVWDTNKLRFLATGTTFGIAYGLALAAQFALVKPGQTVGVDPRSPAAMNNSAPLVGH